MRVLTDQLRPSSVVLPAHVATNRELDRTSARIQKVIDSYRRTHGPLLVGRPVTAEALPQSDADLRDGVVRVAISATMTGAYDAGIPAHTGTVTLELDRNEVALLSDERTCIDDLRPWAVRHERSFVAALQSLDNDVRASARLAVRNWR